MRRVKNDSRSSGMLLKVIIDLDNLSVVSVFLLFPRVSMVKTIHTSSPRETIQYRRTSIVTPMCMWDSCVVCVVRLVY